MGAGEAPATIPGHGMRGRADGRAEAAPPRRDALVGAGFSEAIGWSFQAPEIGAASCGSTRPRCVLRNPLSEDLSDMRTTLLGSLLDRVRHNTARGPRTCGCSRRARSTSTARTAASRPPPSSARRRCRTSACTSAALMTGRLRPASWGDASPPTADFFAAKGVLETLLGALRVPFSVVRGADPFLHPGRAARVLVGGEDAGWLGEVHPRRGGASGTSDRVAGFELDLGEVLPHADVAPHYEDLTSFPAIRQDLAFWVPADAHGGRAASRSCAARAASCCATCACSTSTRARGRRRWPCGSSSARPTAR